MTLGEAARRRLMIGYLAALGASFSYGASSVIARKVVIDYSSPMVGTAFSMLFGTLILAALFQQQARYDVVSAPRSALIPLALAGCAATWGVSFFFLAMNEAPVVLVAPLTGVHPLVSILLTHIFLQRLERVSLRTVLGATLVVAGVVVISVGNN